MTCGLNRCAVARFRSLMAISLSESDAQFRIKSAKCSLLPAGARSLGARSSGMPPMSVAIQGQPRPMASRRARGMPSAREGRTNNSRESRKSKMGFPGGS